MRLRLHTIILYSKFAYLIIKGYSTICDNLKLFFNTYIQIFSFIQLIILNSEAYLILYQIVRKVEERISANGKLDCHHNFKFILYSSFCSFCWVVYKFFFLFLVTVTGLWYQSWIIDFGILKIVHKGAFQSVEVKLSKIGASTASASFYSLLKFYSYTGWGSYL